MDKNKKGRIIQDMEFHLPNLRQHVPLAPLTTFRIGGPARYFVKVTTRKDLQQAMQAAVAARLPWFVLGAGSNVLIADAGFPGLVIATHLRKFTIDVARCQVRAESGLRLAVVITKAFQQGCAGLEFAIGVPASVGGAIWANLGAREKEMRDVLVETTVLDTSGTIRVLSNAQCRFGYRDSIFKHEPLVILDGLFQLEQQDKQLLQTSMRELSALRNNTQDVGAACAGCIFRNPKDQTATSAAALIDEVGLKGMRIGGAEVSERHANFIINTGNATAEDVLMLISLIKQKVRDTKGIQLMEEIAVVGFGAENY